MKNILRFIVALIFIASGFVKAVDLKGFSFKMEEYFSPAVFNMPFLEQYALGFAIIVVILELALGLMLLLRIKLKFTILSLIGLCVFFGFLTFYSAYFNVVTDCGCFGDAIKFTPWQSFIKDIVLLVGLLILYVLYKKNINEKSNGGMIKWAFFGLASVVFGYIMCHGITHEPIIDFRSYKIGTDMVSEKKKIEANPSQYKTFYSLKNDKTGEIKKVDQDEYVTKTEYWSEGSPWKIENDKTTSELVKEGYASEIAKFKITDSNGNDVTEQIITAPKTIIVFSYKPKEADQIILSKVENKAKSEKNTLIYGVSPEQNVFKVIENGFMDGTAIKTIARSNPFVLTIEKGKITNKQPAKEYVK